MCVADPASNLIDAESNLIDPECAAESNLVDPLTIFQQIINNLPV